MSTDPAGKLIDRLTPRLARGDISGCESAAVEVLLKLPKSPFHIAAKLEISNDPAEAARHFDNFYRVESKRIAVKAVYTEMNGFDINPGHWHCDLFAYTSDDGLDDPDWLSDWQSEDFEAYPITGLEPLQKVYAGKASSAFSDARDVCSVVVVAKFQSFMQRAAKKMRSLRVPLYVTAHDYDYIARIVPGMDSQ